MRLSTNTMYAMGTQAMLNQQSKLAGLSEQLASGRRIVRPSDDPNAATQALTVSQAVQVNDQYSANRATAQDHLAAEENQLKTVTNALTAAKPLLVQAANGTLSDADRNSVADSLEGVYNQILSSANSQDGNGRYIFSGFASDTKPFTGSNGSLSYQGDEGQRKLQVDGSSQIAINDSGSSIFSSVTASARYVGTANKANTGSGVLGSLNVTDGTSSDRGDAFALKFHKNGNTLTYNVFDITSQKTVASNQSFKSGQPIALGNGLSVTVIGAPADNDSFSVGKNQPADNNILNTLSNVVTQLRKPSAGDSAGAALTNTLNRANVQLDNAIDNVSSVVSRIGARGQELDALDIAGANQQLTDKNTLSNLQDIDQISAISDFSLAKIALQLSQQTFSQVQKLSLFGLT